ncbi:MAG TPA: BamA/TamA family outer membrane protein [Candidatus Limnocylindrales bacterium]|nr:BamA/TamA family outer membrane protein [Candidatus Limnocylindrales bacterium]
MRRALALRPRYWPALGVFVSLALGLLPIFAAVASAAPSEALPGGAPPTGRAPRGDVYLLRRDALPDSLRAEAGAGPADSSRLWSGPELESAALKVRDLLARRGDAAAIVRLVLSRGIGGAPGTAALSVARPGAPAAPLATVATLAPSANPVLNAATPLPGALADSLAAAYRAASHGAVSIDGIAAGLSAARDVLIDAGYYAAEVGLDSLAVSGGCARAHLRVLAGPPAVVEAVELPGGTATRPSTAASIAGLRSGMRVTPAVLAEARERLAGSGLFTSVGDPRLAPGTSPGGARVVIPVEEERSSRFEGALGVAREGGVTGLVDLALGNIAGSGRSAGLRWFGPGGGRSEYAARYREPSLFGRRVDATVSLDAQVADSLFTQTRWSLAVGRYPGAGTRASLALVRSGSVFSGLARGSTTTWSLAGQAAMDRLRPVLNPRRGFRAAVTAEGGSRGERFPGLPPASHGLFRGDVAIEGAVPAGPDRAIVASARGRGAFLGGDAFPAEELFFVGGSEGLRGHPDRAFAGSRVAVASIEHRWITDERGGRLYLFGDAARHELPKPLAAGSVALPAASGGSAASLARTVLSRGWEFGYGAGLRTRMASGLVGLELGFAPGEPLRRATIHVRYASTW